MKTKYNEILVEVKESAAWITINRPEVRNAFREQTLDELREAEKLRLVHCHPTDLSCSRAD